MKRILVLGPSQWDPARGAAPWSTTPATLRRRVAEVMPTGGSTAYLMEDEDESRDLDILEKFRRLSLTASSAIALIWPPRAKMQTTLDELLLLRNWRDMTPPVWLLYHEHVLRMHGTEIRLRERGARSRYMESVPALRMQVLPWRTIGQLMTHARIVSADPTRT